MESFFPSKRKTKNAKSDKNTTTKATSSKEQSKATKMKTNKNDSGGKRQKLDKTQRKLRWMQKLAGYDDLEEYERDYHNQLYGLGSPRDNSDSDAEQNSLRVSSDEDQHQDQERDTDAMDIY